MANWSADEIDKLCHETEPHMRAILECLRVRGVTPTQAIPICLFASASLIRSSRDETMSDEETQEEATAGRILAEAAMETGAIVRGVLYALALLVPEKIRNDQVRRQAEKIVEEVSRWS